MAIIGPLFHQQIWETGQKRHRSRRSWNCNEPVEECLNHHYSTQGHSGSEPRWCHRCDPPSFEYSFLFLFAPFSQTRSTGNLGDEAVEEDGDGRGDLRHPLAVADPLVTESGTSSDRSPRAQHAIRSRAIQSRLTAGEASSSPTGTIRVTWAAGASSIPGMSRQTTMTSSNITVEECHLFL